MGVVRLVGVKKVNLVKRYPELASTVCVLVEALRWWIWRCWNTGGGGQDSELDPVGEAGGVQGVQAGEGHHGDELP